MKIIAKDNFDRENISEFVVATEVNKYYANLIAKLLNNRGSDDQPYFYKAVPDDYKLYTFEP